jgi:hypothetical protein
MNLVIWVMLANLFSISLVENRYQNTVVPAITERYEHEISVLKAEVEGEPEKYICFSKTEIIGMLKDNETGEVQNG